MEKSFIFLLLSYILPFSASSHSCFISHCNSQSRTSFNAQHHSAAILARGMRRERQSSPPFPPPRPHCALTRNQLYYTYHIPPLPPPPPPSFLSPPPPPTSPQGLNGGSAGGSRLEIGKGRRREGGKKGAAATMWLKDDSLATELGPSPTHTHTNHSDEERPCCNIDFIHVSKDLLVLKGFNR